MAEFDLGNIFQKAFGYEMPEPMVVAKKPNRPLQSSLGGSYYATDLLGREFFLPLKLEGVLIPFAVVGVVCKKILVETPMPERGGSVTELISIDDYQISLKGLLITDDGTYPEEEVFDMHAIFQINRSLRMECVLTDIFLKKEQLVIVKDCRFNPVAGVEHVRPFEMELKSNMIFDLETVE